MNYSILDFKKLKNLGGFHNVHIISGSMEPWIGTKEVIKVQVCNPSEIRPYDIIVYWEDNKFICHILIEIKENLLITKGLANKHFDTPTDEKLLLGKVIKPKFRWWHRLLLKLTT